MKNKVLVGFSLIGVGFLILLIVIYKNSRYSAVIRTFSPYSFLTSSWEKYKTQFINEDGRVIDYSQDGITTSEGQSYCLLRSVWVDDKDTFDKCWKWTNENLKRNNDNLFGWRWGRLPEGSYGFINSEGKNSASDADSDIALALIFAARRWKDFTYQESAVKILNDLWKFETAQIDNNKRFLIAGNWAQDEGKLVVNLSYFAPYAWRVFADVNPENDWQSLIDPAYEILEKSSQSNLDKIKSVGLPPDWISIDKKSGDVSATGIVNLTTNYSFDAVRIPWRIALDYKWNQEQKAADYLKNHLNHLKDDYVNRNQLAASYTHDGIAMFSDESPTMYATSLGYFMLVDEAMAKKIYEEKILSLYSNDTSSFKHDLPYYDQNWLWFGAALYNNFLSFFE